MSVELEFAAGVVPFTVFPGVSDPEPRGGTSIGVIITTRKLIFHEKLSDVQA
jgi:hypothetical protein